MCKASETFLHPYIHRLSLHTGTALIAVYCNFRVSASECILLLPGAYILYFHFPLLNQLNTHLVLQMAESSLQRLLALGASLPESLRQEHRELVHKLAHELHVPLVVLRDVEPADAAPEPHKKTHVRDEINRSGASSAREKFQKQERQHQKEQKQATTLTRKVARHGTLRSAPPATNGAGNSDCDISSPEIKTAYVNLLTYVLFSLYV